MTVNNITHLEQEFEIGDYVQIKDTKEISKAIVIYKVENADDEKRKYKYIVVDNEYNKRTYYADQMIKLKKTTDRKLGNVVKFKKG